MRFLPYNRNISVKLIEEEVVDEGPILLPAEYRPAAEPYTVVCVTEEGAAGDCQHIWQPGWLLVVEAQMIRTINYEERTYHTIAENYVIASLSAYERA